MASFSQLSHTDYITLHPKLELHAHISGSINEDHLVSLIKDHWTDPKDYNDKLLICKLSPDNHHDTRDLDECFELFKVLHHIIDSEEIIHMVTLQVLEDFVFRDHVCYIELRTTPRPITKDGQVVVTMEGYMATVVRAIKEFRMIMAFLAHKYQILTILAENGIVIDFLPAIGDYSPYGQKIINRFDSFFMGIGGEVGSGRDCQQQESSSSSSAAALDLSLDTTTTPSNPIPLPLTSPATPQITSDMLNRIGTNTILTNHIMTADVTTPTPTPLLAHYHSNKYSLSSVALSIASFVSAGILFSFDRASFTHESCDELLNIIEKLRCDDDHDQNQNHHNGDQNDGQQNCGQNGQQFSPVPNSSREIIVGLDFSGNPFAKNLFNHFLPFWERSIKMNLLTSIHFAETKNDTDSRQILTFKPYRLGHAAVLNEEMREMILNFGEGGNDDDQQQQQQQCRPKMGIEVCLSSNKACKLHTTINTHPVVGWIEYNNAKINQYFESMSREGKDQGNDDDDHANTSTSTTTHHPFPSLSRYPDLMSTLIPITLCTDDSGVFSCSLVDEWLQMLNLAYFNHNHPQLTSPNTTPNTPSCHGAYTYPIKSLTDPNEATKTVSIGDIEHVFVVKTNENQQLCVTKRGKFDDFIRINNFAQTGIQSIFQRQYIPIVYQVFEKFRPVE